MYNLPITHIIDNLTGGMSGWTQEEVEQALYNIEKPIKQITLYDISEYIKNASNSK